MISISTLYCGGAEDLRALRYGPAGGRHRKEGLAFSPDRKPIVVWNCTRRCNLRCMHCYSQSADRQAAYEMSGEEAIPFMEDLARFGPGIGTGVCPWPKVNSSAFFIRMM